MKKDFDPVSPPVTTVPPGKLKTIIWDNGLNGYLDYRTDGKLNYIQYIFGNNTGKTLFDWADGKIASVSDDRSLYKNVYHYLPNGQLSYSENVPKTGTSASSWQLEYSYNGSGKVDSLKYYVTNEAGKVMKSRTGYTYNAQGELTEAVTISGDLTIRHIIEGYSQQFQVETELYLESSLTESYPIFNLPVISQSGKMPTRITRMISSGTAQSKTDKIQETQYVIVQGKMASARTVVTFPDTPASNSTVNAQYNYQP